MSTPPSPAEPDRNRAAAVRLGALAPLSRPGWVAARLAELRGLPARRGPLADRPGSRVKCLLAAGARILRDYLAPRGGTVIDLDLRALDPAAGCDELAEHRATAVLLLIGRPELALSMVTTVRRDQHLAGILIGAPAGQPEFPEWTTLLGHDGAGLPFLRYLPEHLDPLGARVRTALSGRLAEAPSFVAFEGYDTVTVLAELLRFARHGPGAPRRILVAGRRRGQPRVIRFCRTPGVSVWQWAWPPIQVADRDPAEPEHFRILHTG